MDAFKVLAVMLVLTSAAEAYVEKRCALIFDFDGVIKTGEMSQADDVVTVVRHAESQNYAVGLATMSCEETFIRGFLKDRISSSVFTEEMLDSEAAQFCEPSKPIEMKRIIDFQEADPHCSLLFDDSIGNKSPVEDAGYIYIHTIANIGITYTLYNEGLEALASRGCNCYPFTL